MTDQLAESLRRLAELEKSVKRGETEREELLVKLEDCHLSLQQEINKSQRAQADISSVKSETDRKLAEKDEEIDTMRFHLKHFIPFHCTFFFLIYIKKILILYR